MSYTSQNPTPEDSYGSPPPPRRHPERVALRRNAGAIGFGLLLMYVVNMAVGYLLYFLAGVLLPTEFLYEHWTDIYSSILLLTYIPSLLIPCLVIVFWVRIPKNVAFPMRKPDVSLLLAGFFVYLGSVVVGSYLANSISILMERLLGYVPVMPDIMMPESSIGYVIYFVYMAIAPAIMEEILFRGVILQSLRRFGDGFALLISAILFGIIHGNLVQAPNAFILGITIGFFVLKTGSLWTGILIHLFNNGVVLLLDEMVRYFGMSENTIYTINSTLIVIQVACAAIAMVYLLRRYPGFLRLDSSRSHFSMGRKCAWFFTSVGVILILAVTIYLTSTSFEVA
jgi:membrane protease YdiL (CAAX protease family)